MKNENNVISQVSAITDLLKHSPRSLRSYLYARTIPMMEQEYQNSELPEYRAKFDALTGGTVGVATGAPIGVALSKNFDNKNDSIATTIMKRLAGGAIGGVTGGAIGAGSSIALGKTSIINKLYQKLGVMTQQKQIASRDLLGRMEELIKTKDKSFEDKDDAFINLMRTPLDYKNKIIKHLNKKFPQANTIS